MTKQIGKTISRVDAGGLRHEITCHHGAVYVEFVADDASGVPYSVYYRPARKLSQHCKMFLTRDEAYAYAASLA